LNENCSIPLLGVVSKVNYGISLLQTLDNPGKIAIEVIKFVI
jgi:hypothetical protein